MFAFEIRSLEIDNRSSLKSLSQQRTGAYLHFFPRCTSIKLSTNSSREAYKCKK